MKPAPLLVVLLAFCFECNAQDDGKDFSELQERGINGYFEKNQEIGYTGKVYQIYSDGQMKGQLIKGKKDGLWVWWRENGKKSAEGNYKDGEKQGLWTWWYGNEQKKKEVNYKDGKREGLWVEWHENGQKRYEENIKDGKIFSAKYWNSKGEPVKDLLETLK